MRFFYGHTLIHHGIQGQKWGVRNGPPYPLNPDKDYSSSEKLANVDKRGIKDYKEQSKKQAVDGLIITAAGLAVVGVSVAAALTAGFLIPNAFAAGAMIAGIGAISTVNAIKEGRDAEKADKRIAERRKNEKKDKNGLYRKNEKSTPLEDCKEVNPYHVTGDGQTSTNCQYCSIAFDLRQRGYDVIAADRNESKKVPQERSNLKKIYGASTKDVRADGVTDREIVRRRFDTISNRLDYKEAKSISNNLVSELSKTKNSRGVIGCGWYGGYGVGHSMQYTVSDGVIAFYDSQIGKTYTVKEFTDKVIWRSDGCINVTRLDNKNVNIKEAKKYVA